MPVTLKSNTIPTAATAAVAANEKGQQQQPRVSFNRDVHVKRIGKRLNELTNYETTNLQPPQSGAHHHSSHHHHQLPVDLSAEDIRKEAALVLAQAERHHSKAKNGDSIPTTFRVRVKRSGSNTGGGGTSGESNPKKFHSLPTRRKKAAGKPVTRSVSDAAAKKPHKRPSIFNIFSRKSDTQLHQPSSSAGATASTTLERDPRFEDSGGRRLVRSKSDVGQAGGATATTNERKLKKALKETKANTSSSGNNNNNKQLPPTQLSPIIENAQKEDYFAEQFNRERRKSEAITEREKNESGIAQLLEQHKYQHQQQQLQHPSQQQLQNLFSHDAQLLGRSTISTGIKEKILTLQSKSQDNMHSSQLPAQKPLLTKGVTVNGLVQRLSMERFSPPPAPISGTAFSYIRPNEGITYAQLELNDDQPKSTGYNQHQTLNHQRQRVELVRSPTRELRTTSTQHRELRDVRDARNIHSPERDIITTTLARGASVERSSAAADFLTSQNNLKNIGQNNSNNNIHYNSGNSSRILIEPNGRVRDSFSPPPAPVNGGAGVRATTIRIGNSHSPSPWQQLSPRNLSDEDEGLGFETRKYYDDDLLPSPAATALAAQAAARNSKSPPAPEPPIVPVIRSLTPTPVREIPSAYEKRDHGFETRAYQSPPRYNDTTVMEERLPEGLGNRRARLESRILTRRFGDSVLGGGEVNGYHQSQHPIHASPDRPRYLYQENSREREQRFHKPETTEILHKYSPERSHLDIIAPRLTEKPSRYKHYHNGRDEINGINSGGGDTGVSELFERETPHVRERLESTLVNTLDRRDHSSTERHLFPDYGGEPKSLDSQFTSTDAYRSSPENMKRYEYHSHSQNYQQQRNGSDEHWNSGLKRDKMHQRSFDKGDSGIENDFRKESFNGDLSNRWRKKNTIADDIRNCEMFLKKERRHSEQNGARRKESFVYRERSIDDGSHYDPHLDKYPVATNTLRRRDQQSQTTAASGQETLKRGKKLGGFEKVKQLFGGGGNSGNAEKHIDGHSSSSGNDTIGAKKSSSSKQHEQQQQTRANSSTSSSGEVATATRATPTKDKNNRYMVKEEEMRSRYYEHRTNGNAGNGGGSAGSGGGIVLQKATDISTRRRLSTPKASPLLLKRTSSDKSKQKNKESPLAKTEKTSWFKSLDRRAKSKSKEKLDVSVNGKSELSSSLKRSKRNNSAPPTPPKNLRFFGDTDVDSNPPTISRATTMHSRSRPTLATSTLNRSQKYSQSAYHLDRINAHSPPRNGHGIHGGGGGSGSGGHGIGEHHHAFTSNMHTAEGTRLKSNSMHNLERGGGTDEVDFRKRRHYSRSRDLDDISESGSETEEQHKRNVNGIGGGGGGGGGSGLTVKSGAHTLSRDRLEDRSHRYENEHAYRRSNERNQTPGTGSNNSTTGMVAGESSTLRRTPVQQHLNGPPKPARSAERRILSSYSRERERFPAESSGTEGESSLHSQRSVVYLHATTAANIPQPYHLRRRSVSRDDLRSQKSNKYSQAQPQPLQPMTRSVSRSVSMLAPWKPKFISEGYEINYSQEQNKTMATLPRHQQHHNGGNASGGSNTLMRNNKNSVETTTPGRTRRQHEKDEQSSLRNSSTTSASKSALSAAHLRNVNDTRRKFK